MKIREFILRGHLWLVATLVPLAVKFLPLKRLLQLLTPPRRLAPYAGILPDRIVAIVERRLRRPRNMRRRACLRKGTVLFHFLRLAGVAASLHISVYPPPARQKRMLAHCWVSVDGRCLCNPPKGPVALSLVHGEQKIVFA